MKPKYERIARKSTLLANAPEDVVTALLDRATIHRCDRGTTIFAQDDPAEAIFIVLDGWVKLHRIAASGIEAIVGVFSRGHSFGESVAMRQGTYPVFAESVTDCILMRFEARDMFNHMRKNPEMALAILNATYAHLISFIEQIEQLKARTGPQRVAEFLLALTKAPVGACSVKLPYDKVLIAGQLGMKPESLSRAFTKLRGQGVRVRQTSAEIDDVQTLRGYAERDRAVSWQHH
ncbi:MAG: Crp/Fnr family transcriptional regulator [Maritimibacter sp.]|nr:Crp/Fnr family transcriptional regulator [Maritimibacter sp.]